MIATLIICQEQFDDSLREMLAYALPGVALVAALLMVSQFPYKRFYRTYLLGRFRFESVIFLAFLFAVFWSAKAATLLVLVMWYMLSGPLTQLLNWIRGRQVSSSSTEDVDEDPDELRRHA